MTRQQGGLLMVKGFTGLITIGIVWVNTNLSPLFWAVLIIAALDILLHLGNEQATIQKMIKGTTAVIIPWAVANANHLYTHDFETIRVAIALVLIVQLTSLVPQMLAKIKGWLDTTFPQDKAQIEAGITAVESEISTLKSDATRQTLRPPGSTYLGGE